MRRNRGERASLALMVIFATSPRYLDHPAGYKKVKIIKARYHHGNNSMPLGRRGWGNDTTEAGSTQVSPYISEKWWFLGTCSAGIRLHLSLISSSAVRTHEFLGCWNPSDVTRFEEAGYG
jgi:hypothetical protein